MKKKNLKLKDKKILVQKKEDIDRNPKHKGPILYTESTKQSNNLAEKLSKNKTNKEKYLLTDTLSKNLSRKKSENISTRRNKYFEEPKKDKRVENDKIIQNKVEAAKEVKIQKVNKPIMKKNSTEGKIKSVKFNKKTFTPTFVEIENQSDNDNFDFDSYGFDLYKHLKENLRNKEKLCKDQLTKNSYYCKECKQSTCVNCLDFIVHKEHTLIPKYLYYNLTESSAQKPFKELDAIWEQNPDYLDNQKLKNELKTKVTNSISQLMERIKKLKEQKLKEIEHLFDSTDGCVDILKDNEMQIKQNIKEFFEKENDFSYVQIEQSDKVKTPDINVLKNLNLGNMSPKTGMIESNQDAYNSTFLINYDIIKNINFINSEIVKFINNINTNREKYLNEYNSNLKQMNDDLDKFFTPFNGEFNYNYLTTRFYKIIKSKIKKYIERINNMKKYIYSMVNKDGNFDRIDNENKTSETKIKQKFDNILNYQISEKDDTFSIKSKNSKYNILHRTSLRSKSNHHSENKSTLTKNKSDEKIYEKCDDIKLNKEILQKYFSYDIYDVVLKNFRAKKKKLIEEELDEEIDIAKPISGTNEIQIYDKVSSTLSKKVVNFDKNKHKYTIFLDGCRSVRIKDLLYILGGVDKEKIPTKIAYVYYIKTNELKLMPEMLQPHAYHSVQFLDYYKSIIVLGGENSASCELYDLNTGLWRELPSMKVPKAHCNLYLDKFSHALYTFFGVVGDITEKHNYTDVIECLELKRLSIGWSKIDYNNKAEMDFKSGYNKILPLSNDMILIYGATNMRDFVKKAAVYLMKKFEIVKIDNKIFKEIKETSKHSKKLDRILSTYI